MDVDLYAIRIFVTVVETGGYTAASEKLGLSQSTVSTKVAKLEHQLGAQLLRYENRNVLLTQTGEKVYETSKAMLQNQDHLFDIARSHGSSQIRFGASIAFEQNYFLEKAIAPFIRQNDGVLVKLWFGHSVQLAERVRIGDLDLALVLSWKVPEGLWTQRLGLAEFRFLVNQENPLAGQIVSPQAIAAEGIISAPLDSIEWSFYGKVLAELDLLPSDVKFEISGVQARMLAARQGLGVVGIFFPDYGIHELDCGLSQLQLDRASPTTEMLLVRSRKGPVNEVVVNLGNWIRTLSYLKT